MSVCYQNFTRTQIIIWGLFLCSSPPS